MLMCIKKSQTLAVIKFGKILTERQTDMQHTHIHTHTACTHVIHTHTRPHTSYTHKLLILVKYYYIVLQSIALQLVFVMRYLLNAVGKHLHYTVYCCVILMSVTGLNVSEVLCLSLTTRVMHGNKQAWPNK